MRDDLLGTARRQAENANPSMRAAALLRIARAETAEDVSRARKTLLEGLEVVRSLPNSERRHLFEEARSVAAAVSPEMLDQIPITRLGGNRRFASGNLVQIMLAHGHCDAAVNYLLHYQNPASFPFSYVGNVLHELDLHSSDSAARQMILLRHAVNMWRRSPTRPHHHEQSQFVQLFGHYWKEFPAEEALAVTHMIVTQAAEEPDVENWGSGYPNGIHFTSSRQNTLFQILHILRHFDPALAQSLINSHDQLAVAAHRYPNGLETLNEEVQAEVARRKAEGATCGDGCILMGDPGDFDRQRRLIDATRSGDFGPSIEDAIEKYREDTSPATRNYAPKEYWPSTGAFRTLFYEAGMRLGTEATKLLDQIPDDDLRLFATIELATALTGLPCSSIMRMKQPRPLTYATFHGGRLVDARSMKEMHREGTNSPTMRSPDGGLIRCPKCLFQPPTDLVWTCKCGRAWNTFLTAGNCPACHFQWELTGCPSCGEMSEHRAWYASEQ